MGRFQSWITKKRMRTMTNPQYLSDRSIDYWKRYCESRRQKHLNAAVAYSRRALRLLTGGDPLRSGILDGLGNYLYERYERWGEMDDLEEVIELRRAALALCAEWHPDRATSLNNLANSLSTRFRQTGREEDLKESIDLNRAALALRPEGHPYRDASLNNLANSLSTRFRQTGREEDLEESIDLSRADLALCPEGHPYRDTSLNSLANSLSTRFRQTGREEDLEESIDLNRAALALRPEGHPYRDASLNNLANSLSTRFRQTGREEDLEESIDLSRADLALCPEGHPYRDTSLNNLANSLSTRFRQTGREEDLKESIDLNRAALALRPEGHPYRDISLNNLANSLSTRFRQTGREEDLKESIDLNRAALALRPEGHPYRDASLNNLANSLSTRFRQTGREEDLEESIDLSRADLALCPEGHPYRDISLNSLANSLSTRFRQTGREEDLEESIDLNRAALALCPEGHPYRDISLNSFASSLSTRFGQTGREEDLKESIDLSRTALAHCPEGHPRRATSLKNLAECLFTRFKHSGRAEDVEESIESMQSSSLQSFSSLFTRLQAATRWTELARSHDHTTALEAYATTTSLMEQILTIRPDLHSQHDLIDKSGFKSVACDAMSYAIAKDDLRRGIELLEQGRGLLWSQLRGFRTPLVALKGKNNPLAIKFDDVSRRLETLAMLSEAHVVNATTIHTPAQSQRRPSDEMFALKRHLTIEQERVIKEIRIIPGFEDFLRPMAFATLRTAAKEGPVIIVNTCKFRSDATIVLPGEGECVCVPLDGDFYSDASELTDVFLATRRDCGPGSEEYDVELRKVLKMLWDRVVCHVVQKLDELGIAKGSRIWWCPTSVLTALPFHAAGPYVDANGEKKYLLDDYISSYTPTLKSLVEARSNYQKGKLSVLHVRDPDLSSGQAEMDTVRSFGIPTKQLVGSDASSDAVMINLQKSRWVHLTCHGLLDPKPFNCSFKLSGGRLTLLDIVKARLPNAELAFLSACHSAEQSPGSVQDEVLHLAAAMQFCGFRSVIGTMWKLADEDGPAFAKGVYAFLSEKPNGQPRFKGSAAALRMAALDVREQEGVLTERWVNFVHIGA